VGGDGKTSHAPNITLASCATRAVRYR
jgi:hypothetical protein